MSEEILIRQGAPTLAGIKTGSLFPCPCEDREDLLADIRRLNRLLVPKGLCLLPIRFLEGQALLYLYRPAGFKCAGLWKVYGDEAKAQALFAKFKKCTEIYCALWQTGSKLEQLAVAV